MQTQKLMRYPGNEMLFRMPYFCKTKRFVFKAGCPLIESYGVRTRPPQAVEAAFSVPQPFHGCVRWTRVRFYSILPAGSRRTPLCLAAGFPAVGNGVRNAQTVVFIWAPMSIHICMGNDRLKSPACRLPVFDRWKIYRCFCFDFAYTVAAIPPMDSSISVKNTNGKSSTLNDSWS